MPGSSPPPCPTGPRPTFEGDEVAGHAWLRPTDALAAMADGRLAMWLPTSTTLQQLAYATSIDEIRERVAPGRLGEVRVEEVVAEVTRIVMPAGGGVAGQPVCAYLVGRAAVRARRPGRPDRAGARPGAELAAARGGAIEAVVLTHVDPDHAAGAEAVAETLGVPVLTGPGGGRPLPYAVRELADLEVVAAGDVPAPRRPHARDPPDHLACIVGRRRGSSSPATSTASAGARSHHGAPDEAAWPLRSRGSAASHPAPAG